MRTFNDIVKSESKRRKEALLKLHSFITNPGRFSVLLLGARGTGKTYWLQNFQNLYKTNSRILDSIYLLNASNANSYSESDWTEIFKKTNKGLLVIKDVENLSKKTQALLFDGISTGQGGKLGFKKKEFDIRIAFTSTKDISKLRDNELYLSHKFFDRICQFAVELPTHETGSSYIWEDFKKTWKKMNFQSHSELPSADLREWLESNNLTLFGNFRDLDKIAIIWHNYRLLGTNEDSILLKVKSDFINFCKYPENKSDEKKQLEIRSEFTWADNLDYFKMKYVEYLIEKYGKLKIGAKEADVSYRTMERWASAKRK